MAFQYERVPKMPTPSADLVGTIYKYAGLSTDDYERGAYYKCVKRDYFYEKTTGGNTSTPYNYSKTNETNSVMPYVLNITNSYIWNFKVGVSYPYGSGNLYSKEGGYTGILQPGETLSFDSTTYMRYNIRFTWYEWQKVEVDEHETVKYFSQANVAYLLSELTERIKQSHINE